MNLQRLTVSATATRYLVSARLGPYSKLLLVSPDGLIITGWRSAGTPEHIFGEWISPFGDLVVAVDGVDLDSADATDHAA